MTTSKQAASAANGIQAQLAQGMALLRRGALAEAQRFGEALVAEHEDNPSAFALMAEVRRLAGDPDGALQWLERAIAAGGGGPFLIKKAWLLSQMLRREEVPAVAAQVEAAAGKDGGLLWQLGKLYHHHNQQDLAIAAFERALPLVGDHPSLLYDLAISRFFRGDFAAAETDLDRMLSVAPQAGPGMYLRAVLRRQRPDSNHVDEIQSRIKAGMQRADDEAAAWYALAKELDDLGDHGQSFDALTRGAALKRRTFRYDVNRVVDSMKEITEAFDADTMAAPTEGHDDDGAIFIVGLPRSGTTLVERVLLQSGQIRAAGELMDFGSQLTRAAQLIQTGRPGESLPRASRGIDFAKLGRDYMRGARPMAQGSHRFIDKLPANFIYCGIVAKALPKARIIHLQRDPLDSCYAVFKTLFFGAYEFSYDLDELGTYYTAYRQMMAHWHTVMPQHILDVSYEDLVTDPAATGQRIYEWCGLPWDVRALSTPDEGAVFATASAAQVREPVHQRSVNSSRRHIDRLGPLVEKLSQAGLFTP